MNHNEKGNEKMGTGGTDDKGILMKRLCFLFLFFIVPLMAGCVSEKYFDRNLQSYIGKASDTVLRSVGPPQQTLHLQDAKTLWIYDYSRKTYLAESMDSNSSFLLPISHACRYWFSLNSKEIVTGVGHKGNHCRTSQSGGRGE